MLKAGERAPACHQNGAAAVPRQQAPHLGLVGGVVEHEQHPTPLERMSQQLPAVGTALGNVGRGQPEISFASFDTCEAECRRLDRERSLNDPAQAPPEPAADQTSPSMAAARTELQAALREELDRLPEHYRRVIELRIRGKVTFEEIGREVGLSADAARKVWARALTLLHGELRPLLEGRG